MKITLTFIGVPVSDLEAAQRWYGSLLGRVPDVLVNEDEVMWSLQGPSWLYLVRSPSDAGHARVLIGVEDLDGAVAELAARGHQASAVDTLPDARRKYRYADADGNEVGFAELRAGD